MFQQEKEEQPQQVESSTTIINSNNSNNNNNNNIVMKSFPWKLYLLLERCEYERKIMNKITTTLYTHS